MNAFDVPLNTEKRCKQIRDKEPHKKHNNYRITGIFCGCLIFAEFCGSIEIAEIKNRKIFQSRYNDEIVSKVIVQSRILMRNTQSIKWHTVFES